jgi:putative acetyltransferase
MDTISIREPREQDLEAVLGILRAAFSTDEEAELVRDLLHDPTAEPIVSLLAIAGDEPVGHILFTRVVLEGAGPQPLMHILAPLAVVPAWQGRGLGGRLIRSGLDALRAIGSEVVFVLGHESYYPRSGFVPDAERFGMVPPYPIPKEHAAAWMYLPLDGGDPGRWRGKLRCADSLDREKYWAE